jgi:Zn-dependent protease with chaperone function
MALAIIIAVEHIISRHIMGPMLSIWWCSLLINLNIKIKGLYLVIIQIKDIDPSAVHLLMRWSRASEISADRAGMLCCKDLGSAATALFKTSSGLSGIGINRVLRSFRKQYEDLEIQIKSFDNAPPWVSTPPMIPIRFKALELATLDIIAFAKKARDSAPKVSGGLTGRYPGFSKK